jgi:lipoprotein-anchoring transpeptidase ErfK/SrfK
VLAVQQRLVELGYWLGRPDGVYGYATEQAVYALQKAAGLARDGRVGARTRAALVDGARPTASSETGHVVEIDLAHQLLLVVDDGQVTFVLNTSTGSGGAYWYQGSARRAVTPRGHYAVYAEIDGLRRAPLGLLWRPKYFHGGIAVHGSPSVPPWPASHGCVRVSYPAMNMLWADGLMPIGTAVWVR